MLEKLIGLIAQQLEIPAENISETTDLVDDLNADSLDIVQMLILLENEFGVTFEEDEIKKIKTVGDVAKYVEEKQQ